MKLIAVGDIHGRDSWKKIAEQNPDFDTFVFIGDYFDNFPPMTCGQILANFVDILAFKKKHGKKVVLCMGNHDFQYTPMCEGEKYSGYDPLTKLGLDRLGEWWKQLQPAYQYEDMLFTHAGLTKTWAHMQGIETNCPRALATQICGVFEKNPDAFRFFMGDSSGCGEHAAQGPFWVRPRALAEDMWEGITHVVGHTNMKQIVAVDQGKSKIVFLDAYKSGEYLLVEDGVACVETVFHSKSEMRRVKEGRLSTT